MSLFTKIKQGWQARRRRRLAAELQRMIAAAADENDGTLSLRCDMILHGDMFACGDICFSDSRVLKFGDWTAPSITHLCLLRLIAPIAIISRPRFTRCATPDQKRPMTYVRLPDFEMNDGSIATAMSSDGPKQSCAIPMLTFIQSTDVLKLEAKVLAVRPP